MQKREIKEMSYTESVDIRQGTKSTPRYSNGNTLPLTQLPFGMASFVPQTNGGNGNWFYYPEDRCLEGVRLTHQPSPWIGDYGTFVFQPQMGTPCLNANQRWSGYRPEQAVLRPDYLSFDFLRSRCQLELTPTERGAAVKLNFRQPENCWLSFFSVSGENSWRWDADQNRLVMTTTSHNVLDNPIDFKMYAVVQFELGAVESAKILAGHSDGSLMQSDSLAEADGSFHLPIKKAETEFQLAISYISEEQAICNLRQESGSFAQRKQIATDSWEERLSRISVETETEKQKKTFYTCLYRTFLFPHKAYELDENGNAVHYSPCDGKIRPGVRYTDNGFWDTFRTVYPLFAVIARKEYAEMLEGFINDYRDSGWLPRWLSLGEVNCMPSTLIDAVIADAAVKGIVSSDLLEIGLEGMLKHANQPAPDPRDGRHGVVSYLKHGYVPCDEQRESVNLTLDAAYGDFCIAQVAEVLNRPELAEEYRVRAKNYRNLFDSVTGFMRPRDSKGELRPDFSPFGWGRDYTEGGPWQTSFFVPHDVEGLAELHGGKEALLKKLDELFATPPLYEVGGYGFEIHEMSEMAAVDFGQCAISNQPSFHIPYLYAMLGEDEKANFWIKKICDELFTSEPDGLPGDEDNGTMAAWYVFSCLGLYPFCPGKPEYIRSRMLVKSARINGKDWDSAKVPSVIPFDALPIML